MSDYIAPTYRVLQSTFNECLRRLGANFTLGDVLALYGRISPQTMTITCFEDKPYLDLTTSQESTEDSQNPDYFDPDDFADSGGPKTSGREEIEYLE